ncbi:MAG: SlyX family protein [Verrucomicrobiales bacterium]|nr:SlyX family protein [Verrucomicrobiales bacterium]
MGSADDERLQRIEIHLAHLERQGEELNGVIIEQGKQIARLQTLVNQLTETVEQAEGDRIRATSSRPPHSAPPR